MINNIIEISHRPSKKLRIFHVNMLKQWDKPVETAYLMTVTSLEDVIHHFQFQLYSCDLV